MRNRFRLRALLLTSLVLILLLLSGCSAKESVLPPCTGSAGGERIRRHIDAKHRPCFDSP